MPELPDLQVIGEYLNPRLAGVAVRAARVRRPIPVRNLLGDNLATHLVGRRFTGVSRRGKFLLLGLEDSVWLAINPMLAGRIRYGEPLKRDRTRDAMVIDLAGGNELRYNDAVDMGKVYLTGDLAQIPGFASLGPDALDPGLTLDAFLLRIRRYTGEIKSVLTNQDFVAGIGNAYADEICWQAGVYPFRRRATLQPAELTQVYQAMRAVLSQAIETLRARVGDAIDEEIRDFLAVHGKAGQPCPKCGSAISEVTRDRRATHFCRTCQPGLLVDRG